MFHTRPQLLNWIVGHTKRESIKRAIQDDGMVLNLGVFTEVPGLPHPGWIVDIASRYGRRWFMAVTINKATRKIYLNEINAGQIDHTKRFVTGGSLFEGDPVCRPLG